MEGPARKVVARMVAGAGLVTLLVLTGCVGMDAFTLHSDGPATGAVCQVHAIWQNHVVFAPDPVHGGAPTPGLVGRVYLFGSEIGYDLAADGDIVAQLFDDAPKAHGGESVLMDRWRIDRITLKRLLKKDPIGWGYTLFLPLGNYRPDLSQVHLVVRYEPVKGTPVYAPQSDLVLVPDPDNPAPATVSKPTTAPAQAIAPRPAPAVVQAAASDGGFASARE